MPLQIRRGTQAEANVLASPPQNGELVYVTDSQQLYIGDGTTLLKDLMPVTGYTDEEARNAAGAALSSGTHSGISFVNDNPGNKINATLDSTQSFTNLTVTNNTTLGTTTIDGILSVTGKLIADFNGSIHADDSTLLVDGVDSKINLDGTVKGNIIPDADEAYDIGSSSLKFKDLYLSGSSLWLGSAQVTATGSAVNLPAGSTIDGEIIQSEVSDEDAFVRDLQGSVFADDSTILVNAIDGTVKLNNGTIDITGEVITSTTDSITVGDFNETFQTVLEVVNKDSTRAIRLITVGGASPATPSGIALRASFGDYIGSGSEVQGSAGDYIGNLQAQAWDPVFGGGTNVPSSAINFRIDPNAATIGNDQFPGSIEFVTNKGTGSSLDLKYMVLDSEGQVGINQQTPTATLDVNGFAKLAILTAAPTTPANGMIAIADGTSWDPLGGGASGKQQMVVYLGGAWTQIAVGP
jgi:hypothetical protein